MRRAFLVTYDIGDPKRLRSVYRLMRGYGDHLQLSVFHCELSDRERVEMEGGAESQVSEDLGAQYPGFRPRLIDADEDRVRADIAVSVDGEISAEGLRRKVGEKSEVHFLPAMSGG